LLIFAAEKKNLMVHVRIFSFVCSSFSVIIAVFPIFPF